jgi:hypothetical protein
MGRLGDSSFALLHESYEGSLACDRTEAVGHESGNEFDRKLVEEPVHEQAGTVEQPLAMLGKRNDERCDVLEAAGAKHACCESDGAACVRDLRAAGVRWCGQVHGEHELAGCEAQGRVASQEEVESCGCGSKANSKARMERVCDYLREIG